MDGWKDIGADRTFEASFSGAGSNYTSSKSLWLTSPHEERGREELRRISYAELETSELALEMIHTRQLSHPNLLLPDDLQYLPRPDKESSLSILSYRTNENTIALKEILEDEFLSNDKNADLLTQLEKRTSGVSQNPQTHNGEISENNSSFFILPNIEHINGVLYRLQALLSALCYLHSQRILHDDIRLGSVVEVDGTLCLVLGGRAKNLSYVNLPKADKLHYYRELLPEYTPGPFKAPERVLNLELKNASHLFAGDIWSLGILTYQMLCNRLPFGETKGQNATFFASFANKPHYIRKEFIWSLIEALEVPGHPINNILRDMLDFDPSLRPSAFDLLQNPIFNQFISLDPPKPQLSAFRTLMYQLSNSDLDTAAFATLGRLSSDRRAQLVEMFYFK